jgi:hypothetical protein
MNLSTSGETRQYAGRETFTTFRAVSSLLLLSFAWCSRPKCLSAHCGVRAARCFEQPSRFRATGPQGPVRERLAEVSPKHPTSRLGRAPETQQCVGRKLVGVSVFIGRHHACPLDQFNRSRLDESAG